MNHETALASVSLLLTLALASPDAAAQAGRTYYRTGLPNVPGSACSSSGCHASDPLSTSETNRVMKAAGSASAILGSPDQGMQAVVSLYDYDQLEAIAGWLLSLTTPPPPPPPPSAPPPPPPPPPPPSTAQAVEYHHTAFNHYFVSINPPEIAALDDGTFAGWTRTGRSFAVYPTAQGFATVCRFFTAAFSSKYSHFYTANPEECAGLKRDPNWVFENEAFWVQLPNALTGICPKGTKAVYRVYNNGQSGAPNHRFTTDPAVRADMIAHGWIPEGAGPEGVAFCSPN